MDGEMGHRHDAGLPGTSTQDGTRVLGDGVPFGDGIGLVWMHRRQEYEARRGRRYHGGQDQAAAMSRPECGRLGGRIRSVQLNVSQEGRSRFM
jgi:hypothetical protein